MEAILRSGEERREIRAVRNGEGWTFEFDGERNLDLRILDQGDREVLVECDGRRQWLHFVIHRGELHLHGPGWTRRFMVAEEDAEENPLGMDQAPVVRAPMPGKVLEILAAVGDRVRQGQPVLRVEAMKMEVDLVSPFDGTVVEVDAEVGRIVDPEHALMRFEPAEDS